MQKLLLVFGLALIGFAVFSCVNTSAPTKPPITTNPGKDSSAAQTYYFCTTLDTLPNYSPPGHDRAVGAKDKKWPQGSTLKILFLSGGTPEYIDSVKSAIATWGRLVNLHFTYVTTAPADIRISFNSSGGAWSFIGTDAKYQTNQSSATINLGFWQYGANGKKTNAVALHEFGHALFMTHEQQNPNHPICWKTQVVIDELKQTNGWTPQMVWDNVLTPADPNQSITTPFDPLSIMLYQIPGRWTCDGTSYSGGSVLSAVDKAFISGIYPKTTNPPPPPPPPVASVTITTAQANELKAAVAKCKVDADSLAAKSKRILGN